MFLLSQTDITASNFAFGGKMDMLKWQKTLQEIEPLLKVPGNMKIHFTASISLVVHMFQHGKSKND